MASGNCGDPGASDDLVPSTSTISSPTRASEDLAQSRFSRCDQCVMKTSCHRAYMLPFGGTRSLGERTHRTDQAAPSGSWTVPGTALAPARRLRTLPMSADVSSGLISSTTKAIASSNGHLPSGGMVLGIAHTGGLKIPIR